jgi:hypothetical protein
MLLFFQACAIFAYTLMNGGKEPESTKDAAGNPAVDLSILDQSLVNDDTKEFFEKTIAVLDSRPSAADAGSLGFVCWAPWSLPEPENDDPSAN